MRSAGYEVDEEYYIHAIEDTHRCNQPACVSIVPNVQIIFKVILMGNEIAI